MDSSEVFKRIREVENRYVKFDKVEVIDPDHRLLEVDERWVRAFQVVVNRATEEEFVWLRDNFTIFSGPNRHEKMIINKDGTFESPFEEGFFDACDNMAIALLFNF